MKLLALLALIIASSTAFSQNDLSTLVKNRIETLESTPRTDTISKTIVIKAKASLLKEKYFLESILSGYEYLRKYSITYRYIFLHEGLKAASTEATTRDQRLNNWLVEVNRELSTRYLHASFDRDWRAISSNIKTAINELSTVLETVPVSEQIIFKHDDEIRFLKTIDNKLTEVPVSKATGGAITALKSIITGKENIALFSAIIFGFLGAMLIFRKQKPLLSVVNQNLSDEPPLFFHAIEDESEVTRELPVAVRKASNLEESYIECLKRNEHLIKQAEIKILNGLRSPFKTSLNVPQERLDQALNFLLQGTLAVANTSTTKASHMEWNCIEQEGRYSLNLVLHGVSCDEKNLFLNTIIDTEFSGPAYFGRTEQTLEEYQPTVLFSNNQKKTTISLSIDNFELSSSQSH